MLYNHTRCILIKLHTSIMKITTMFPVRDPGGTVLPRLTDGPISVHLLEFTVCIAGKIIFKQINTWHMASEIQRICTIF